MRKSAKLVDKKATDQTQDEFCQFVDDLKEWWKQHIDPNYPQTRGYLLSGDTTFSREELLKLAQWLTEWKSARSDVNNLKRLLWERVGGGAVS